MKSENQLNIRATFNDISTTRAACIRGMGWAILPKYTIKSELEEKKLVLINTSYDGISKFGIWWLRNRKSIEPLVYKLKNWLELVEL